MDAPSDFSETQQELLCRLYHRGAVQIGGPFKLKNGTLSPLYFNLRTKKNPKPGPLEPEDVLLAAREMYALAKGRNIIAPYVAGVPYAGDPFAEAFCTLAGEDDHSPSIVAFAKVTKGDERRVCGIHGPVRWRHGADLLIIDDLITSAQSKLEAIEVARTVFLNPRNVLVLIDREQGGVEGLKKVGVVLRAVFRLSDALDFYRNEGLISEDQYALVRAYLAESVSA